MISTCDQYSPFQRYGGRDGLEIRMAGGTREINAVTLSTMKREVGSLKSEARALRTGHVTATERRMPLTPEEKHRHEVNSPRRVRLQVRSARQGASHLEASSARVSIVMCFHLRKRHNQKG